MILNFKNPSTFAHETADIKLHGVPEGGQKQKKNLDMTHIFFESIHPKASRKGRKKIFGVQKFDFFTF